MKKDLDHDVSGEEFTESERRVLRRIARDQERLDWLWASLRIWGAWMSAVTVGGYAMYEVLLKIFKKNT